MTIETEPRILSERLGAVQVFTLNRPEKRNAVNDGMMAAFRQARQELES